MSLGSRIEEIEEANYKIADLAGALGKKNEKLEQAVVDLSSELKGDISRFIEFSETDYEYGLAILSHFGKVVQQKFTNQNVRVRIEQTLNTVRLVIHSGDNELETIEKTLAEYGKVVSGIISPEDFFEDRFEAMRLRHKLESAANELRQTKEMYALMSNSNEERISFLETQVSTLNNVIAHQLCNSAKEQEIISIVLQSYANLQPDMLNLMNALRVSLENNTHESTKNILLQIRDKNPSLLDKLEATVYNTLASTSGSILYAFITSLK